MPCLAIPWQLGCEGNAQFFQRRCQRLQLRARAAVRTCATEDRQGAEHEDRHDGEKESSRGAPKATVSSNDLKGPTFQDGVDAYCWWLIGLLFLTDYTPVGAAVASSSQPLLYTAAIQVLLFAAPTVVGSISRGEEIRSVYRVRGCTPGQLIASAGAGVALYAVITAAEQARDGASHLPAHYARLHLPHGLPAALLTPSARCGN